MLIFESEAAAKVMSEMASSTVPGATVLIALLGMFATGVAFMYGLAIAAVLAVRRVLVRVEEVDGPQVVVALGIAAVEARRLDRQLSGRAVRLDPEH